MGNCYSGDHIAADHIQTDIATCKTEESQQKYCHGKVGKRLLGRGREEGLKHVAILQMQHVKFGYKGLCKLRCL